MPSIDATTLIIIEGCYFAIALILKELYCYVNRKANNTSFAHILIIIACSTNYYALRSYEVASVIVTTTIGLIIIAHLVRMIIPKNKEAYIILPDHKQPIQRFIRGKRRALNK